MAILYTASDLSRRILLIRAIIYSVVVLAGVTLIALIATTGMDWFYPTLAYSIAVYVAWEKFFSLDPVSGKANEKYRDLLGAIPALLEAGYTDEAMELIKKWAKPTEAKVQADSVGSHAR